MKKIFFISLMLLVGVCYASAQGKADIKFDKVSHDFGKFSVKEPIQEYTFTFTNVGDAPLVINQAVATCGCTVPSYTKTPIAPGQKGSIKVTYNGTGKTTGTFKKSITVRTNAVSEMTRLHISGEMTE